MLSSFANYDYGMFWYFYLVRPRAACMGAWAAGGTWGSKQLLYRSRPPTVAANSPQGSDVVIEDSSGYLQALSARLVSKIWLFLMVSALPDT